MSPYRISARPAEVAPAVYRHSFLARLKRLWLREFVIRVRPDCVFHGRRDRPWPLWTPLCRDDARCVYAALRARGSR